MKKATFEENMTRLEEIVSLLEQGDAPLSESLALFPRAVSFWLPAEKSWIPPSKRLSSSPRDRTAHLLKKTFYPRRKINELSRTIYRLSGGY